MAVGQLVKKFTWLLDNVEVKGIVRRGSAPDGTDLWEAAHANLDNDNSTDWFDIVPDSNYAHLVTGGSSGRVHCETYVEDVTTNPNTINKVAAYPIPTKPEEPFRVVDPATGQQRNLRVGDHVRVIGRWVIDHHPEGCVTRHRGWLRVGCAHVEFHPFRWDTITLIKDLKPSEIKDETLSIAAPLYDEVYLGTGKWLANEVAGVASKIFIAEDGSNYHNTVTANAYIKAPPLPAGFTPHSSLIAFSEEIRQNGTGLNVSQIRSLTVVNDGINVTARVIAPVTQYVDGLGIADVNDPANGKSVFQARYPVRWLPRLVAVYSNLAPLDRMELAPQVAGSMTGFLLYLQNRGPDNLQITSVAVVDDPDRVFQMNAASGTNIPPGYAMDLSGTFSPTRAGTFSGTIVIFSTDPANERLLVDIRAEGLAAAPRPKVEVSPSALNFGSVPVGIVASRDITVRNVGTANAFILEVTKSNLPRDEQIGGAIVSSPRRPAVRIPHPAGEEQFQIPSYIPSRAIPPGQSQVVPINYAPTLTGAVYATLKLVADDAIMPTPSYREEFTIALQGQGVAPRIVLTPRTLDFGTLPPGGSVDLNLQIKNEGNSDLVVTGLVGDWVSGSFVLDPAVNFPLPPIVPQTYTSVRITFNASPTPGKRVSTEWEVKIDPQQTPSVKFSLIGMSAGPHIEVWPDFVDFHRVQPPALQEVIIRNTGTSDLFIRSVKLHSGGEFSITGLPALPFAIPAGQEQKVQIEFSAQTVGQYNDTLVVASEDLSRPKVTVGLQAIRV